MSSARSRNGGSSSGIDIDAMIQILAERALLHQLVEVAMRGHDHAHIHRNGAVAAHALHLPLFQHAQQLGLHHQRHVADLIQKQRAVVGLLELADVPRGRAGERALSRGRTAPIRSARPARPRSSA